MPPAENDPCLPGVAVLYDLALKRYDFLSRSYDTANTRVGAVFAFSSLVISGSTSALKEMYSENFHPWIMVPVCAVLLGLFIVLALHCLQAYSVRKIWPLPDASKLYAEGANRHPDLVKSALIEDLIETVTNATYEEEINRKTAILNRAIHLLMIEVCLVFVVNCLPYLPHRSWYMSSPKEERTKTRASVATVQAQAAPIAPPADAGAEGDVTKSSSAPRLFAGPPGQYMRRITMSRSVRGVRTMEKRVPQHPARDNDSDE